MGTPPVGLHVGLYGVCPVAKRIRLGDVRLIRRDFDSLRAVGRVIDVPIIDKYVTIGPVETESCGFLKGHGRYGPNIFHLREDCVP